MRKKNTYNMVSTEVFGSQSKAMHPFLRIEMSVMEEAILIIVIATPHWLTNMVIKQNFHILNSKFMNNSIKGLEMCHGQHKRIVLGDHFGYIQRGKVGIHILMAITCPHVDCIGETHTIKLVLHKFTNNVLQ